VPECQLVVALDEDVGLDELLDRIQQVCDRHPSHLGQVIDGEPPAQGGSERRQAVGGRGHAQEPATHVVTDAPWEAVFEEPRSAGLDSHDALVLEAAEELHEQERVSLDSLSLLQKLLVRLRAQNVPGDLGDSLTPERTEADHLGPRVFQLILGTLHRGKALVGAERQHPPYGQGGEPLGKLPHRHGAAISGPVEVIQADEQGVPECCLFDQGLEVLE
jgi:hypothetical protein